ncbi:MAG: EamA family transporter [Lachnospiraceae bacterium]|nr:EamA family transporter [Lachnospiraceae bacterium]
MGKKLATLSILGAGITWGMIGIFVRRLTSFGFDSMEIAALRSFVALFFMMIVLLIYNINLFRIRWRDIWCYIGTGILSLTFFNVCYFKSIQMTSLSVAAILLYTAPSMVMLLSAVLFKEKVTMRKVFSILLAFAGCIFVTGVLGSTKTITGIGVITGLGSGFGYALYSVFSRYALDKKYHSLTITLYTFLFASIGIFPLIKISNVKEIMMDKPESVLVAIGLGTVSTVCPYILYTFGLSRIEASKASIIASIEPVVATLIGVFAFHEMMEIQGIFGVLLVIISIIIINVKLPNKEV